MHTLWLIPFVLVLAGLAILPVILPHAWEDHRQRLKILSALSLPTLVMLALQHPHLLNEAFYEYLCFLALLVALYVICGGIVLKVQLPPTPAGLTGLLAFGAFLASWIGTTGASMLLIRPLLRSLEHRQAQKHTLVFFIFLVSNIGGLLTPLGDPPLFLGFLRGVPFFWTMQLLPQYLFLIVSLLSIFYLWDSKLYRRQLLASKTPHHTESWSGLHAWQQLAGKHNLLHLAILVGITISRATLPWPKSLPELLMLALAAHSYWYTPRALHQANHFQWDPIYEIASVFMAIFSTMVPALHLLQLHAPALGCYTPGQFFWITGLLSSALDNAPTYLALTAVASGLLQIPEGQLQQLSSHHQGSLILNAISTGAVVMGAMTYIGNGPNMMVRAIAQHRKIAMPSFLGYLFYSCAILLPLLLLLHGWLYV